MRSAVLSTLLSARQEIGRRELETLRIAFGDFSALLDDPNVTDLILNQDGRVFEDRVGVGMTQVGTMEPQQATAIINMCASIAGAIVNRNAPIFEGELPIRNARFIGFVPPLAARPAFAIRLPPTKIYTLDDYVAASIATTQQVAVIDDAIRREWNIIVAGGTKSGKTTFVNAVLDRTAKIHPRKRICIIEEIVEIQCAALNTLQLRTGPHIDQQDLLMRLMRARPDIIVLGEVRDKAAIQLNKATNTGHGAVISTTHANSPRSAPQRLESLCEEGLPGVDLRSQIADALDVIVGISRVDPADLKEGEPERRVTEIIKVEGFKDGQYVFKQLA